MNQECITVHDKIIDYSVRSSDRAQRLRIAVYSTGDVVVTRPQNASIVHVRKFVELKRLWVFTKLQRMAAQRVMMSTTAQNADVEKLKAKAEKLIARKVAKWNQVYGFGYQKMTIKNMKSQWGSCSSKGNLSFNLRIVLLPKELQDYVVVHELCHLEYPNHSQKYWNLVEKALPDYKLYRDAIRNL